MIAAFRHQVMDGDIHTEIEYHTRLGQSSNDTIAFIQILNQLYGLCRHLVDEYIKIQ